MSDEGHLILYSGGEYFKNLAWARSGNLPFYILCNVLIALWAFRWFGRWTAVAAVGLFSALPPVLGHAGVATTDMAATCGMAAVILAFCHWFEKPGRTTALILGIALAFAALGKVSVLPFFALGAVVIQVWAWIRRLPAGLAAPGPILRKLGHLGLGALACAIVIWAPYHFRFAAMSTGHGYRPGTTGLGWKGRLIDLALDTKIPLGEFLGGLGSAATFNNLGYGAFFMGQYRDHGWWYFFPVVLAIKTPLAFLLLTFIGIVLAIACLRGANWQRGTPFLFALAILVVCMSSSLNLGVRHILPIYPELALMAGYALVRIFETGVTQPWKLAAGGLLVAAFAAESFTPHPDYLAAFNLLAGPHPEKIVVASDIDWGQDTQRLATRLHELKVPRVSILFLGNERLERFGLPPYVEFRPEDHPTGWVAVSMTRMMLDCAKDHNYCEWKDRKPVERVGRSIYLFYVPERDHDGRTPTAE